MKKKLLILLLVVAFATTGCSKDEEQGARTGVSGAWKAVIAGILQPIDVTNDVAIPNSSGQVSTSTALQYWDVDNDTTYMNGTVEISGLVLPMITESPLNITSADGTATTTLSTENDGNFTIDTASTSDAMVIANNGNIDISGDLKVTGLTTLGATNNTVLTNSHGLVAQSFLNVEGIFRANGELTANATSTFSGITNFEDDITIANNKWLGATDSDGNFQNWFRSNASSTHVNVGSSLHMARAINGVAGGMQQMMNIDSASTQADGDGISGSLDIDNNSVLTWYGESDGAGSSDSYRVGIGTSTPISLLHVDNATATTTATFGGSELACMKFRDTDDAGWSYATFLDGVMTVSTDSCE